MYFDEWGKAKSQVRLSYTHSLHSWLHSQASKYFQNLTHYSLVTSFKVMSTTSGI